MCYIIVSFASIACQKAFADRVDLDPGSLDRGLSVTDSPPPHAPLPPTSLNSPLGRLQRSEVNQSIDHKKVPPMFRKPTLSLDTPGDNEETRVGLHAFTSYSSCMIQYAPVIQWNARDRHISGSISFCIHTRSLFSATQIQVLIEVRHCHGPCDLAVR